MKLEEWIFDVRNSLAKTQVEFGQIFAVTKGTVSGWEKGRYSPSYTQIVVMSKMSGMPMPDVVPDYPGSATFFTPLSPSNNSNADAFEQKYTARTLTYGEIAEAVSAVLKVLGIRYVDLVGSEDEARARIERALRLAAEQRRNELESHRSAFNILDAEAAGGVSDYLLPGDDGSRAQKRKPA